MSKNTLVKPLLDGPEKLAALLAKHPGKLTQSYGPGKWTAHEIVSHLADCEVVMLNRFFKCIGEPGQPQIPFDHDGWITALKSAERPVELSLQMLRAIRAIYAWYVENLTDEALARTSEHPNYGPQTAGRIAARAVIHFEHHLGQIECALEGRAWAKDAELEAKLGLPY